MKRLGRPPSGDNGECVRDYPQLALRIPPATLDAFRKLAKKRKVPMWRLFVSFVRENS